MKDITVRKAALIAALVKNRREHRTYFLEAQKRYREYVVAELDEQLKTAREGKPINFARLVGFEAPQDHTKDYDRVISMLQMDTAKTVVLSEHDYMRYVLDSWEWMRSFASNVTSYGVSSSKLESYTSAA